MSKNRESSKLIKEAKTEREKVGALYDIIGERGLYVNTNHDVFTARPEEVPLAGGAGYKVPLIQPDSHAYAAPLLFASLTSLLNHGTMLITGAPGIGKTTGAEFAGHFFTGTSLDDIMAATIHGHPQLTEEKMVARYNLGKLVSTGEEDVNPRKFLQSPVKLLNEGNRMPPDTLSIIMDLVDRGKVTYGDVLLEATPGPLIMTANYADEGTFHFTPPFLDRFDVAVMVTSPQPWDLSRIRGRGDEKLNGELEELLQIPECLELDFDKIRREIRDMPEKEEYGVSEVTGFADFLYGSLRFSEAASDELARATKGNAWQLSQDNAPPGHFIDAAFTYTVNESSIRTVRAMQRYAKAFAWLNGNDRVEVGDLKRVLPYLLWHKIQPTSKALASNPKHANDRIAFVDDIVETVENEYTEMQGDEVYKKYAAAIDAIRTGRIGDRELGTRKLEKDDKEIEIDEVRTIARNAISEIGKVDKPWAITLASHVAAEYNERARYQNGRT